MFYILFIVATLLLFALLFGLWLFVWSFNMSDMFESSKADSLILPYKSRDRVKQP